MRFGQNEGKLRSSCLAYRFQDVFFRVFNLKNFVEMLTEISLKFETITKCELGKTFGTSITWDTIQSFPVSCSLLHS